MCALIANSFYENALVVLFLVALFAITSAVVWFFALLVRRKIPRLSLPSALVVSHTALLVICVGLFPTGIFLIEAPFDDLYLGYYLFPGIHLYIPAGKIVEPLQPLLANMPDRAGALLYCLFLPGLVCAVLGGLQWYVIGKLVEWIRGYRSRSIPEQL